MSATEQVLEVGDLIEVIDGPWQATWKVVEIIAAGARIEWTGEAPRFVGWTYNSTASSGAELTATPQQGFVGRAHWSSAKKIKTGDSSD